MKGYELLTVNEPMLRFLMKNGIRMKDVELIDLCHDAADMFRDGMQKTYIVEKLAEKYGRSVRSIYSDIERLNREVVM